MWTRGGNTLKRIAIIDNTIELPHGSKEIQNSLRSSFSSQGEELELLIYRGPEGKLPSTLSGLSGVLLSGSKTRINDTSPWVERQMDLVKKLHTEKIPSLGICYGEQLFAKALHGESFVSPCKEPEYGFFEIHFTEEALESSLFYKIPKKFYTFCYHYDQVCKPPANFKILASSKHCGIQAYEVMDAPMWGIQFHPEKNLEECRKSIEDIKKHDPSIAITNMEKASTLYDKNIAKCIFSQYLKLSLDI